MPYPISARMINMTRIMMKMTRFRATMMPVGRGGRRQASIRCGCACRNAERLAEANSASGRGS
jgi:hypothetical protein